MQSETRLREPRRPSVQKSLVPMQLTSFSESGCDATKNTLMPDKGGMKSRDSFIICTTPGSWLDYGQTTSFRRITPHSNGHKGYVTQDESQHSSLECVGPRGMEVAEVVIKNPFATV